MCPHLHAVLDCYRIYGALPERGRYVVCHADAQMIIHGDGFWVWSDDPRDIEDCYASR